ncbi:zinc finger BED domain-containing protein RICESLEEPER 3-like [Nilaparvata lugens]|uniref:zinc finger BED domain-containing protein RICESLEEPER 3-like n=1 Tax=Nilaparvata lugens TaxID=108931 RepID=UPI00193D5730|nr:zinc finger BED domain-containing protein RICESLEEPER 3-like [Nilaparvata lugens]
MLRAFEEWQIDRNKIVSITTDNGSIMVAAVKNSFDAQHLHCFAHTLNLVTEAAISHDQIQPLIKKVRGGVKFIKNSVIMSDRLQKAQEDNDVPEGKMKKMILDVKTRWNSTYYMVEQFLDLIRIISQLLVDDPSSPVMPSSPEIETLKNVIVILRPLESATTEISGDKYVTISKIIPMVNMLSSHLENSFGQLDPTTEAVRKVLLSAVQKRFGCAEANSNIAIATILDPRFKNINFKNPIGCGKAISRLKKLIVEDVSSESEEDQEIRDQAFNFWKTHKELVYGKRRKKTQEVSDTSELILYLANPLSPLKSNPLLEWEDIKTVLPGLYKQSRRFLLFMATSMPCERLFSKAGATVTQDRIRLSGKYLNKLTFLGSMSKDEWFK